MRFSTTMALLAVLALVAGRQQARAQAAEHAAPKTDEETIANATSAAPEAVAKDATVAALDENGQLRTVREGTGSFTCLPDMPHTPGNDPMCMDPNAMEWLQAYVAKKEPPKGKVGFGYMLQGGSDASNADPFATAPPGGHDWIDTGPHVMVFGATAMMAGYPEQPENPDPKKPYVMWPGTPYEHLMIPVR